jgi:hypothetical protein
MRQLGQVTRLLAAALLLSGLSVSIYAQEKQDQGKRDRTKNEMTTMTGCLAKDATGGYVLTDEATGVKTAVIGPTDLEKHSANHKVTLTGAAKAGAAGGQPVFEVSKIQHVSPTCKAPAQ